MKICKNCGKMCNDQDNICSSCGVSLLNNENPQYNASYTGKTAEGKTQLLVTSIILLLGAAASVVTLIQDISSFKSISNIIKGSEFYIFIEFISIAVRLAAGILGCIKCNKAGSARICFILGITVIAVNIFSAIVYALMMFSAYSAAGAYGMGYSFGTACASIPIGCIVPIIYILGARKNMNDV